jgi:cyclic pyranopterin phosphate synthase
VAGIVLAGGKSVRMGRDKALLSYGSTTLLSHTIEIMQSVTETVLVVVDTADRYPFLRGLRVAPDLYPNAGPLGGIVTGLAALEDGYHVVAACDMPFLRPALLRFLLAEAQGGDGAVPEIDGHLEPLCAVYHRRCLLPLKEQLEAGQRAAHRAIRLLNLKRVGEEALRRVDPDLVSFTNINTPEDYRKVSTETMSGFTHLDAQGQARMVDVSEKAETARVAVARGMVRLAPETVRLLRDSALPKGDALATARIAGIMAAKKTGELIPLCHPLPLTHALVDLTVVDAGVEIEARASITGKTGVEMEALTAVAVAALTIYDMVKAVDKGAVITDIRLEYKSGGKSGEFRRSP